MSTTLRKTAEQRREAILEAAKAILAARGFEGTTTRAIAEGAGINEAIIFRHFPTKLDLFHTVIREADFSAHTSDQLETLMRLPLDVQLAAILNHFLDTSWQNRSVIKLMIAEASHDPVASNGLGETQMRPRERLKRLLEILETRGVVRAGQARAAASVIAAAALGFLTRSLRDEPADWEAERTVFVADLLQFVLPALNPEDNFA